MHRRLLLVAIIFFSGIGLIKAQTVTSYGQILTIGGQTLDSISVLYLGDLSFNQSHNSCALEYSFPFPANPSSELDTFRLFKDDITTTGLTGKDLLLLRNYILGNPNADSDVGRYGDFTQDGNISTLDILLLSRVILRGEINSLNNPWDFYVPDATLPAIYEIFNTDQFVINGDLINQPGEIDTDLEIRAFKVGDVDGSYWSEDVMELGDICFPSASPTYPLINADLDSIYVQAGEQISIPIKFDENLDLYGIHFSFQSDKVEMVDVESDIIDLQIGSNYNYVDSSFVMFYVPVPNIEPIDYQKGEVIFTLTLRANEDFFIYDLFEEKAEFPREVYVNADFQTLEITFDDIELSNLNELEDMSFTVFPNPFTDQLFITCKNDNCKDIFIEVLDLRGNILSNTFYEQIRFKNKIAIAPSLDLLSESIYFLRFTSAGRSTFKKIVRIK